MPRFDIDAEIYSEATVLVRVEAASEQEAKERLHEMEVTQEDISNALGNGPWRFREIIITELEEIET